MPRQYINAISQIKTDEKLNEEIIKQVNLEKNKISKGMILISKIKRILAAIVSLLGIAACGGLAYAGLTSKKPNVEEYGIAFSDNYSEYEYVFESQYIQQDGTTIKLESAVCNEGFTVLKFNIDLSDEIQKYAEKKGGLIYLSFNDEISKEYNMPRLEGSNYNLIIDGKKEALRGRYSDDIQENIKNKNYTCYYLYFLTDSIIGNKDKFNITLENFMLNVGEKIYKIDGKLEFEVSKEKALKATKEIPGNDISITNKNVNEKIEKVLETPLQNLVKITEEISDVSFDPKDENCVKIIYYDVYDQNNNKLISTSMDTKLQYINKDGSIEEGKVLDFKDDRESIDKMIYEKYIIIEKSDDIKNLRIEVNAFDDPRKEITQLGEFNIDLSREKITSNNSNSNNVKTILRGMTDSEITEIEDFTINIDEPFSIYKETAEAGWLSKKTYDVVLYRISLEKSHYSFEVAVFKNKNDINKYIFGLGYEDIYETKILDEDDTRCAVLLLSSNETYSKVKNVVDTIKLKNNKISKNSNQSSEERTKIVNDYINQNDEYGMDREGVPNGRFVTKASLSKKDDGYVMKLEISSAVIYDKKEIENAAKLAKQNGMYKFNEYTFYKDFETFKNNVKNNNEFNDESLETLRFYSENGYYLAKGDDYPVYVFEKTPKNDNKYYVRKSLVAGDSSPEIKKEKELYVNLLADDKIAIVPVMSVEMSDDGFIMSTWNDDIEVEFSVKEFYDNCEKKIISNDSDIEGYEFNKEDIGDPYGYYMSYENAVCFEDGKVIVNYKNGGV